VAFIHPHYPRRAPGQATDSIMLHTAPFKGLSYLVFAGEPTTNQDYFLPLDFRLSQLGDCGAR
jgi:hypothetical protein